METRPSFLKGKSGRGMIEYAVLAIIILMALFWMKDPILRAFYGRWKSTGESFAFGRQYAPGDSVECDHDTKLNVWYDRRCYENKRPPLPCAADDAVCAKQEDDAMNGECKDNCKEANDKQY